MKKLLLIILLIGLCGTGFAEEIDCEVYSKKVHAHILDKIYTMIADLHIKSEGYQRYELIAGYGTTMEEIGYAIYKGIKYYPDKSGFIIINTNE